MSGPVFCVVAAVWAGSVARQVRPVGVLARAMASQMAVAVPIREGYLAPLGDVPVSGLREPKSILDFPIFPPEGSGVFPPHWCSMVGPGSAIESG